MVLNTYLEKKYERTFNEPWSELEKRVRERHPDFFELYDLMDEKEPKRFWEFWK